MSKHELTQERLHHLLNYDPESGLFTWKNPRSKRCKVGQVAGSVESQGYLRISVDGKNCKAHRLAWLYMTGEWPENEVDHINGVRSDNRWANLRAATHAENMRNLKKQATNTSGRKGVSWYKQTGKWHAQITLDGTKYHLGYFSTHEDAAQAYNGAAAVLFGIEWQRHPEHQ